MMVLANSAANAPRVGQVIFLFGFVCCFFFCSPCSSSYVIYTTSCLIPYGLIKMSHENAARRKKNRKCEIHFDYIKNLADRSIILKLQEKNNFFLSHLAGKKCTDKVTQCLPGQCLNGGSCEKSLAVGGGPSQCLCTNGWGGPFCSEPFDQCQGQPCHNGGTCESGPGWFRCLCAQGFSGPDCRINVNECSPQPCLGGATCQDGIGGFSCLCPPGRRGKRCEVCKFLITIF